MPDEEVPESAPSVPSASHLPDLPQPGRRSSDDVAIPFDPMGYSVLRSLEEVEKKPEAPMGVMTAGQISDARRRAKFVPKFSTLEGMYAEYPELVASGRLRVERVQPQWDQDEYGQKIRVCGTLSFSHPIITSQDFAARYGGFRYRVFGVVEQENRENQGGPPQPVEIAVAEFEIPIPPNLTNLPLAQGMGDGAAEMPSGGAYDMNGYNPYGRQRPGAPLNYGGGNAFDAFAPVLHMAERALDRQPTSQFSDAAWNVIGRQNETAVTSLREQSDRQMQLLMAQNERLERQVEAERAAARDLVNRPTDMAQMVDGMSRLVQSTKGSTDSDVLRQMRDDHERLIRQLTEDNERALIRIREENDRTNARIQQDAERNLAREREHSEIRLRAEQSRVKDLENTLAQRERESREELDRRESRVRADMQATLDMREREHARRIEEINSSHAAFIANLKDMHDREIRLNETVSTNTQTTTGHAHEIEMRALRTELAKVQAELRTKSDSLARYEAEKNKPLLDQVREHKDTIEALNELTGKDDSDDEEDKPAGDKWYNSGVAREVAAVVAQEGAKLLPKIGERLGKMNQAPQAAPAAAMAQRRQMPPAMRRNALPARTKPRVTFADADGPRTTSYEDLPRRDRTGDISHKVGGPRQFNVEAPGPAIDDSPLYPQQAPEQPPRQAAPRAQPAPRAQARPTWQAAPAADPAQSPGAPAGAATDWSAFSWLPMETADIQSFVQQMNMALASGATADQLGDTFVANYPIEVIANLIQVIDIKRLVETIRACPATKDMPLASGKGRRFLADTWQRMDMHVQQAKTKPSAAPSSDEPEQEPDATPEAGGEA